MLKTILTFGGVAGLIAGGALSAAVLGVGGHGSSSMVTGYLIMLVAFATIPVAIKRRRDRDGGGVIRFWPAFGLGLGISMVAGVIYAAAWDVACAMAGVDFAADYSRALVAQKRASGTSAAEIAALEAQMAGFRRSYANPLYRWPMTFAEIFPVGVLVSLVSAAALRNPRFLPARRAVQATA